MKTKVFEEIESNKYHCKYCGLIILLPYRAKFKKVYCEHCRKIMVFLKSNYVR